MQPKVGVLSAGSFGTALATILATKTTHVTIHAREQEVVDGINRQHRNPFFLSDISLSESIVATDDARAVAAEKDVLIVATPSQFVRPLLENIRSVIDSKTLLLLTSKGIEKGSLKMMHQVVADVLPHHSEEKVTVLSGPTFAKELACQTPSAAVLAGGCEKSVKWLQELLSTPWFRLYRSDDLIGVELGGSLKNVVAIVVGILEGMGLRSNSQAALMTRALAEITRLVTAMGGNPFTVTGLSGMGDLILTCTGDLSRNRQVGIALGKGRKLDDILSDMIMVAEGVATTESAHQLAESVGVEMPIVSAMYGVLYQGRDIEDTLRKLMSRSLKKEIYGYGDE